MRISFPKQTDTNPSLLYTAGRIVFHFMVGAFLAFIPVSAVILQKLFMFQYRGTFLWAVWLAFASLYTYALVRRDFKVTVLWVPMPNLWKGFFLNQALQIFLMGAFIGGFIIGMLVGGHGLVLSIAGGVTLLLLFAIFHKMNVEKEQQLLDENKAAIIKWIQAGKTEVVRNQRIDYAKSGALYLGAVAVGALEDRNAPQLEWPDIPPVPALQFFRGNTAPININPASGSPMTGDGTMGFDMGGNAYGTNSNKLFDD